MINNPGLQNEIIPVCLYYIMYQDPNRKLSFKTKKRLHKHRNFIMNESWA